MLVNIVMYSISSLLLKEIPNLEKKGVKSSDYLFRGTLMYSGQGVCVDMYVAH